MSASQVLSNDFLKGVLSDAMVYRGKVFDFDTVWSAGVWLVEGDAQNLPKGAYSYGNMIVLVAGTFVTQFYFPHYQLNLYWRLGRLQQWQNWRVISCTELIPTT